MRWFEIHRNAANLLLLGIIAAGLIAIATNRKELMPNLSLDRIVIAIAYPGAGPEVVERALCRRVENAILDLQGLEDISPTSHEGLCEVIAFVAPSADINAVLNKVKSQVEAIRDLPSDAEKPLIRELVARNRVARLIISGELEARGLQSVAENFRNRLLRSPSISVVEITHLPIDEISIEVSALDLQRYDISFAELAGAIQQNSIDMPSGKVNALDNDILLSSEGKAEDITGFESIILRASANGSRLYLGDVAKLREDAEVDGGFPQQNAGSMAAGKSLARFNGENAVALDIYRVGDESIVKAAEALRQFAASAELAEPIHLHIWEDNAKHFKQRINLLLKNGLSGLALLFVILMLFLNTRLALWVSAGIPVAFLGAFALLPALGQSINIISLFAFILVMGIVVDDAVVVGESVFTHYSRGRSPQQAALSGALAVSRPVVFAVGTSIAVFVPMLFLPGVEGNLIRAIPVVVIATLLFSLIECFFILPAHLANSLKAKRKTSNSWLRICQAKFAHGLVWVVNNIYKPVLIQVLRRKLLVIGLFVSIFIFHLSLLSSAWIPVSLFTRIDAEMATANVMFAEGTPARVTAAALMQIEQAGQELAAELQRESGSVVIQDIYSIIGSQRTFANADLSSPKQHTGQVLLALSSDRGHRYSGQEIVERWREKSGDISAVKQWQFSADLYPPKPDISIEIAANEQADLPAVVNNLKQQLATFEGVIEIRDSLSGGKQQLAIDLKPFARNLGLSLSELALQVRHAFHGIEVQRFQRDEREVKVWLRSPENERASLWYLENMPIRLPDGSTVPLLTVADIEYQEGVTSIQKRNRQYVAEVSAFVNPNANNAQDIMRQLEKDYLPLLSPSSQGVTWSPGRTQKRTQTLLSKLKSGYVLALLVIYIMMAILFASYSQPFLIMIAIPFGLLGSLMGHWLLGQTLTLWSLVGMIAASGVVVNDNLVLVDYINQCRRQGAALSKAIYHGCIARFRPVVLTSLTTFVGLLPLLFERSIQAQFLIPTAISLAFGVLFATMVCLILVPAMYAVLEGLRQSHYLQMLRKGGVTSRQSETTSPSVIPPITKALEPNAVTAEKQGAVSPALAKQRQSEKGIRRLSLNQIYKLGFKQGATALRYHCPYREKRQVSAWRAGWLAARRKLACYIQK